MEVAEEVPRVDGRQEGLIRSYLDQNKPVIILNIVDDWMLQEKWIEDGEREEFITIDKLESFFEGIKVPVVECGGKGKYGEEPRKEMSIEEYAQLWRSGIAKQRKLYLKDFHIFNALKASMGSNTYTVPPPLDDDWLNEWYDERTAGADDYRFLYLGPQDTLTPLHHDVLCSYSWSANLSGHKKWWLFPPSQTQCVQAVIDLGDNSMSEEEENNFEKLGITCHQVLQGPGEILFVPSGWYHQVKNVSNCLSINHNWFNRSCLTRVWDFLKEETGAVQKTLSHLRPTYETSSAWAQQCERIMRANCALNLTEWVDLLLLCSTKSEGRQEILTILREISASPTYFNFLFPSSLFHNDDSLLPEEEAFRPKVKDWLQGHIQRLEESLHTG